MLRDEDKFAIVAGYKYGFGKLLVKQKQKCSCNDTNLPQRTVVMKLFATVLFAVLALFAIYSEIEAQHTFAGSKNCQGTSDRRCPQILCGPDGPKGRVNQDNSKPFPQCCGHPIC
ncbi:uncharacterized protein [Neodiprion pinetum]|uniref:uncharacterized protein n=1 Tax=Neodiprion pinetum TaxID=441929 RepID=UPI001EE01BF2|nr:uncharacterized protein LOC124223602 isoform X1 [Neodiprion pinetum]